MDNRIELNETKSVHIDFANKKGDLFKVNINGEYVNKTNNEVKC